MPEPGAICFDQSARDSKDTRRGTPRFRSGHVTFFRAVGARSGESELATVLDISATGIGLLVRSSINKGSILVIELNSTVREIRHQRLARVTHVTDQGDGSVLIGCEFASRLSDAELRTLAH